MFLENVLTGVWFCERRQKAVKQELNVVGAFKDFQPNGIVVVEELKTSFSESFATDRYFY